MGDKREIVSQNRKLQETGENYVESSLIIYIRLIWMRWQAHEKF
jgi:hypothetical protein